MRFYTKKLKLSFKIIVICAVVLGFIFIAKKDITKEQQTLPFVWENATVYFMLTDRFYNGDFTNDINFNRTKEAAKLRGFMGGDLKGIIKKIEEGYFNDLGVNAIWMSPFLEQIKGSVDEGTGVSYGFHGYWTRDWTSLDPNFGTEADLKELVKVAHEKGIRVLLDAVVNHTGPVTESDPVFPEDWVRTTPKCTYINYESTVSCTLVENLPDIKTESNKEVPLPNFLIEKWKKEGRYEQEQKELNNFFTETGYPRAPKYYIIKWLSDYIKEYGIDGYRVDTVKHTEESVWQDFKQVCDNAFTYYKNNNPDKVLDDNKFYIVGEVYNYNISSKQYYDYGDKKVNYFNEAFNSLINFEFKWNAAQLSYEKLFSKYDAILNNELKDYGVLNYVSSHDDGEPFDQERTKPFEAATKLLLTPGTAQIYYGDETSRPLKIDGAKGDATLRSFMNWDFLKNDTATKEVLNHWQKLGKFRANHPSVGAGHHKIISTSPYIFKRTYTKENYTDAVIVGLNLAKGEKEINVSNVFSEGELLTEAYSGKKVEVINGEVKIDTPYTIVLLENNNSK